MSDRYVELPSDAAFTLFLAGLTRGRVLKDRSAGFSKPERKVHRYLRRQFTDGQVRVAVQVLEKKEGKS